jgi:cysteine desulfurase
VVYLDWNATTPPAPEVLEQMRLASEVAWANPASVHGPGRAARRFVESAREEVATTLGLDPRDVVLTGGGTEANNLALRGVLGRSAPGSVLVTSAIEHPSVLRAAARLAREGFTVVTVPAGPDGVVSVDALERALDEHGAAVKLVSIQALNHETGVLQPLPAIRALCEARGVWLHSDAVQLLGRLPVEVLEGVDLVTIASHKLRGPKGVGALAMKCGIALAPVLEGGAQEKGVRPGTQDPIACAGFAAAMKRARAADRYASVAPLRDALHASLAALAPVALNGTGPRAPHVLNLSFPGWLGPELCAALDLEGVAVSSGSACSAGTAEPSPVITHLAGPERARSAVRLSLGETTTPADLERVVTVFARVLARSTNP